MPNICENWVRITGSEATINELATGDFCMRRFFPPPADLDNEELCAWLHKNYSTRWISTWSRDALPTPIRRDEVTLEAEFISAWIVPFGFYKLLVGRFPDIKIEYEYHCWESGFIGHGQLHKGDLSDPIHCRYDTLKELNAFIEAREWHVDTGNPQLEYYEGDRSKFVKT
jgi:hypothetical protein